MNQNQIFTLAHELMIELDIHELPVDPFDVAKCLEIPVISYKEAREAGFASAVDNILREKAKADAFCYRKKENYIIFYDESCPIPRRINFTIAHELGHIRLDHFKQDGYYTRYQINKKGDKKEMAADSFAGELLRPPVLLALAGIETTDDIQLCCNITASAANAARKAISQLRPFLYHNRTAPTTAFFLKQFSDFLHTYYCRSCSATFHHQDHDFFCPICGGMNITHKFVLNEKGEKSIMHYSKPATFSDTNQLTTCLRCGNEDITLGDNFCSICGAPLANKCYGQLLYNTAEKDYWNKAGSCGKELPSNARYCPTCGCSSLFSKEELLKSWEEEQAESRPLVPNVEEIPF